MKPLLCSWCALMLVCFKLSGDVMSLVPVADTTISEGNTAHTNPGADTMIVGRLGPNGGGSKSRGLIRFDLSAIPAGAVITSATFTVSVTMSHMPTTTDTLAIHRLNVSWEETEATWENAGEAPWVGGDFAQPADSTLAMQGVGTFTFPSSPQMVATAQMWLTNAATNYGFVLLNQDEETLANARRIGTREAASGRPTLSIGYTSASPPPAVQIISLGLSNNSVVLKSTGTNGWLVVPEYSSNLVSSNWTAVPSYTNSFLNGTNVTIFDRLDPICGPNVFLRIRNTRN